MATITETFNPELQQQMIDYYQNYQINPPAYAIFAAKTPYARITIYASGKIVFQGSNPEQEAQKWQNSTNNNSNTPNNLPTNFNQLAIIGSDEVGNGSYFGPLVVCAAYVAKEDLLFLKELGVKDSKELTDATMQAIAPKIKAKVPHQILVVNPAKYNAIQPNYNAVHMKTVLHNRALYLLEQKLNNHQIDGILVDQFTSENNYNNYLQQETKQPQAKIYFTTKGEQYHLAVASASIIARTTFLDWFTEIKKTTGLDLPMGASAKVDLVASQIINKYGINYLNQLAKMHFKNTEKALNLANKKS